MNKKFIRFFVLKSLFYEKLLLSSRFTSTKLSSLTSLQGILFKKKGDKLHLYSTDLSSYTHTFLKIKEEKEEKEDTEFVIDPKTLIEFLSLLPSEEIKLQINNKKLIVSSNKTKGSFPIFKTKDFPLPPEKKVLNQQKIKKEVFLKKLPLLLFATSKDENRPVLTGVNFIKKGEDLLLVSTDGFRLSLVKLKVEDINIFNEDQSFIIPGEFLSQLIKIIREEKEVFFSYIKSEKIVSFKIGDNQFFSRLIEGEFPPFEKVIPKETNTRVIINRKELLRNIKLVSIFARERSNIVVFFFKKKGLEIRPKIDENGTIAYQEIEIEGEEQKVAFNYKFVLDLLNNISDEEITITIVNSESPVVFKRVKDKKFLHIIMPVRLSE